MKRTLSQQAPGAAAAQAEKVHLAIHPAAKLSWRNHNNQHTKDCRPKTRESRINAQNVAPGYRTEEANDYSVISVAACYSTKSRPRPCVNLTRVEIGLGLLLELLLCMGLAKMGDTTALY